MTRRKTNEMRHFIGRTVFTVIGLLMAAASATAAYGAVVTGNDNLLAPFCFFGMLAIGCIGCAAYDVVRN